MYPNRQLDYASYSSLVSASARHTANAPHTQLPLAVQSAPPRPAAGQTYPYGPYPYAHPSYSAYGGLMTAPSRLTGHLPHSRLPVAAQSAPPRQAALPYRAITPDPAAGQALSNATLDKEEIKSVGAPLATQWTRLDRRHVDVKVLDEAQERYEERDAHIIVLRMLSKDEIQALADRTQELRAERPQPSSKTVPAEPRQTRPARAMSYTNTSEDEWFPMVSRKHAGGTQVKQPKSGSPDAKESSTTSRAWPGLEDADSGWGGLL